MAPEVRMTSQISGTRDGVDWPAPGGTIDVPAEEAATLISHGLAVDPATEETADLDGSDVETATAKGNLSLRAQKAQEAAVVAAQQEADAKAAADAAVVATEAAPKTAKK
ncbi:hypothetical protein MB46_10375 [Arthrobacter alpinus]|uniref:hypothetical protein n=1 Tax=Arthrobacter alpinus TaxID=656366 RepID=UPI0005C99698|nr:hypothetical protein [Arthrobacter alpinus]ALV45826.1 hypothetical protein MB46_10375 [Arthrobacter alpinus]